ncbi:ATP-binding protein [Candidatus Woesearchaeota archaeon]|nr:ATP-binding protein [Candidatus Woesearchaeota archaeon]
MAYDIVVGRNKSDLKKYGTEGTIYLGKHYVKMGRTTSLSNKVYLDMIRSHVVFVCGKRGGGKSYTMGVIAEGMADLPDHIRNNISIIMLDTMGIYWTMKYPNMKDKELLEKWDLKPHAQDISIFTPTGYYNKYKDEGIPTDKAFAIRPAELQGTDWTSTFDIEPNSPIGVLIQGIIHDFREAKNDDYDLDDIITAVNENKDATVETKNAAKTHFAAAKGWGVFDKQGTTLKELAMPGQVTVLDVSCYATEENGWAIKSLVIGLVAQKLFNERMISRKDEEFKDVESKTSYFSEDESDKQDFPMVWLVVDEAHEFMPNKGKTLATDPLVTILREGRQPGISLILATQQPGKIHTDVMTQSDTIISHRITAKLDTDALGMLMQSYMRSGLDVELDNLPRTKGAALILDDNNEKMYPIQIRPRFTWHGGEAPTALKKKEDLFDF